MFIVQSKVREQLKGSDVRASEDFLEELNDKVGELIKDAIARAQANGRRTVRAADV